MSKTSRTNIAIRNMFFSMTDGYPGYDMQETAHYLVDFIKVTNLDASIVMVDDDSITYIIWSRPVPVEVTLIRGIDD